MSIILKNREFKKLVNSLPMRSLENFMEKSGGGQRGIRILIPLP